MNILLSIIVLLLILFLLLYNYFNNKNNKLIKKYNLLPNIEIIEDDLIIPNEKNKICDENIKNELIKFEDNVPKLIDINNKIKSVKKISKDRVYFSASKEDAAKMHKLKGKKDKFLGNQYFKNKKGVKKGVKNTVFNKEDSIQKFRKQQVISAGYQIASMIVAQHYMNEINNKLEDISEEIKDIKKFQESGYDSKIQSEISDIKEIIENEYEILSNKNDRESAYETIKRDKEECERLLRQANNQISGIIMDEEINYKNYIKKIDDLYKWHKRQKILLVILFQISKLKYILSENLESEKINYNKFNELLNESNELNKNTELWNEKQSEKFRIDTENSRREGKFFKVRKNTLGLFKEEWSYLKIDKNLNNKIITENNIKSLENSSNRKLIKIQKYNDEYYNIIDD